MNYKIHREDFYNEDYPLNPQEEKEFQMSIKDTYWKTRSRAYLLDIDIFGPKEYLQQQIELYLFRPTEKQLPSKRDLLRLSNCDLFEKKFGSTQDSKLYQLPLYHFYLANLLSSSKQSPPIYSTIPELKMMRKDLSYNEAYCALGRLSDPQMLFVNMFKEKPEGNLLNGLVYFPYTAEEIEKGSSELIVNLAQLTQLKSNYLCSEPEKLKILRQKLLDMYYLCDDCQDLHGIVDCQSRMSTCDNIASFNCDNKMCKKCCEKSPNKSFCLIHDDMVNFFRMKMHDIFEFEQHAKSFDRSVTIRLVLRKRITNAELRTVFEEDGGYKIDWEALDIKFKKGIERIQFVYLQCLDNEEAKRLYDDRSKLVKKWEKYDFSIQSLMEGIYGVIERICSENKGNLINACLLVVPISNLVKNNKKLPQKSERNKKFSELIENALGIDNSQYTLANCLNLISPEFLSYDYYTIVFNSKELLNRFYIQQPYFDSVIVHKLTHLKYFPLLRNRSISWINLCVNCDREKDENCVHDLCKQCCIRQQSCLKELIEKFIGKCPCSNKAEGNNDKDDNVNMTISNDDNLCSICNQYPKNKNCLNQICDLCCQSQMIPKKNCHMHQRLSLHREIIEDASAKGKFAAWYSLRTTHVKFRLLNMLRNGDFTWFRPITDTNVSRLMLDMNKELMIIMDNPNYKREGPLKINDKMYKVFTYQNEVPLYKSYDMFNTCEAFDDRGEYYIEYDFTKGKDNEYYPNTYIQVDSNKFERINMKSVEKDYSELKDSKASFLNASYHLCFFGLDTERYTTYELIDEIFHELKSSFPKVAKEDIQIIDEVSVLSKNYLLITLLLLIDLIISNANDFNYDKIFDYGRFALITMKSDKDALRIYLEKVKINLPLINNKKGTPMILMGDLLKTSLEHM